MRHRYQIAAALLAVVVAACADEQATAPSRFAPSFAVNAQGASSYVIVGTGNVLPGALAAAVQSAGGTLETVMDGIGVASASSSDPNFATKLRAVSGVQFVDQDVVLDFGNPTVGPEALEATEGGIADPSQSAVGAVETFRAVQWAPDAIHAPAAWDLGYQGQGVRVAILDGGIRDTHIDIAPNFDAAHSRSFVPGQPYNFDQARNAAGVCNSVDTFWHGTHVAGIVAAPANNIGTVGIAPRATIIGVKVLHCGSGSFAQVINGIYYAATPIAAGGAGANIINMSLGAVFEKGGADAAHLLHALDRATQYARSNNVTVIAAAGNDGLKIKGNLVSVPAQSSGVIAVSATAPMGWALGSTDLDRIASYTNIGHQVVSFAAPGGDFALPGNQVCVKPRFPSGTVVQFCWVLDMVMAPCRGSGTSISSYCWAAGTSMASPATAGVAALILGRTPGLNPAQVEAQLRQSSDDLGKPGKDDFYGQGRVNALRAVTQ